MLLFFGNAAVLPAADADDSAAKMKFFETQIRPVLAGNCFQCHGEEKQKGGLRLDHISHLKDSGVLEPGNALKSLLFTAISYEDMDLQMPPDDKKLPAHQIEDIKRWINMGAPWPETEIVKTTKSGGFTEEEKAWWSFQPLKDVKPPSVDAAIGIAKNDVDKFILAKLGENGLMQAPETAPRELVRRLYFNLHGLPPTQAELDAYLQDTSPDKYEKLVDELLASPRYGERWGQHWLDLARYAESDGYRQDAYRPNAWTYRDYVIKSFNEDKPYNQFIREQLAGDEIAPEDPHVLAATGYLRHGVYEWNQADAEAQREIIETELADVTGELFLGLSISCAKCHDHKFDPILQKDYYRLRSFFAPVQWRDDLPLASADEIRAHQEALDAWDAGAREAREAWEKIVARETESGHKKALYFFSAEVKAMMAKPEKDRAPYEKQIAYLVQRRAEAITGVEINKLKEKSPEYKAYKPFLDKKPKDLQRAFAATDVGAEAPPTILESRRGPTVIEPGFLSILAPDEIKIEPLTDKNSTGRRLALANWISSPDNPLSTRVIVNRVWQYHFGRGLSVHASDLGKLGEPPTHPELLDWLTQGFIDNGWSLKWLHRQILNTQTWRQSSMVKSTAATNHADPENKLLWRMRPQRLDAEQARDTLLMLGGVLDKKTGGPAVSASQFVRSIYTEKRRTKPDEFFSRFDAPTGFISVAKRDSTNTPLQSLLLINGPSLLQRSLSIADHLTKSHPAASASQLADKAITSVFGRPARPEEVQHAADFLTLQQQQIDSERKSQKPEAKDTSPLVDAAKYFGKNASASGQSIYLKEGSGHEKLSIKPGGLESSEFTVEAMIHIEGVYPTKSIRTVLSRWNGDTTSHGWAIGVTGAQSSFEPNNLILQAVGEDFQSALMYELLNSGLKIHSKKPYHIAVTVSNQPLPGQSGGGHVIFQARDLSDPNAQTQVSKIPHSLESAFVNPKHPLTLGGRSSPTSISSWFGAIHRVSLTDGALPPGAPPFQNKTPPLIEFSAIDLIRSGSKNFTWSKQPSAASKSARTSQTEALGDLLHALISSNEFLYLP